MIYQIKTTVAYLCLQIDISRSNSHILEGMVLTISIKELKLLLTSMHSVVVSAMVLVKP